MLIVNVKNGESIDRALQRYKRKHRQTKLRQELMRRRTFTKPSEVRRSEILDAEYREKMLEELV